MTDHSGESGPSTSTAPEDWGLSNVLRTLTEMRSASLKFDTARTIYDERVRAGSEKTGYLVRPESPQAAWSATLIGRRGVQVTEPQDRQEVSQAAAFKASAAESRSVRQHGRDEIEIVFLREAAPEDVDHDTRTAFPDYTWRWELSIPEHLVKNHLEVLLDQPGKEPAPYWLGGQAVAAALPAPRLGGIAGTGNGPIH